MSLNNKGRNLAFQGMLGELDDAVKEVKGVSEEPAQAVPAGEKPAASPAPEKPAKKNMVRYNCFIDEDIFEYLRYESARRGKDRAWFLRYIIRWFMENSPEPYISDEKVRLHLSE